MVLSSVFSGALDCSSFILKYLNLFAPSFCYREALFIWISLTCFRPKVKRFEGPRQSFNISKCVSSMGLIFIQAENAYANGTHTSFVVSPWCVPVSLPLSLWQVSQSRLAFLELQSIFNRVAPLPDGPAIYGPERGQGWKWPGARGWRNVSDDRMMDECGAKMREPRYGGVERDGSDLEVVEDKRSEVGGGGDKCLSPSLLGVSFFSLLTSWDGVRSVRCSGCTMTRVWLVAFPKLISLWPLFQVHRSFSLSESTNGPLVKCPTSKRAPFKGFSTNV